MLTKNEPKSGMLFDKSNSKAKILQKFINEHIGWYGDPLRTLHKAVRED